MQGLRSADGHDVGPVDVSRLMLQTRLDAAYQCLDLSTAQVIIDVNPCDNPYPARTELRRVAGRMEQAAVLAAP
jgi:hypothetical protein